MKSDEGAWALKSLFILFRGLLSLSTLIMD